MLVVYPLNQKDVQQKEDVLLRIFFYFPLHSFYIIYEIM